MEKVQGFGGILVQHTMSSLLIVAFGVPQALEQLPQRAVQAALAIRQLVAEARSAAAGEPVPRCGRRSIWARCWWRCRPPSSPARCLARGGDAGPARAATRACGPGGAAGIAPDRAAARWVVRAAGASGATGQGSPARMAYLPRGGAGAAALAAGGAWGCGF